MFISRTLTTQLTELISRLDNMETSIKTDIKGILEMLQHSSGSDRCKPPTEPHILRTKEQQALETQNLRTTTSLQPSESEFSFELCLDNKRHPHAHRMPIAGTSQVHRSISQPECRYTANEKTLLR